MEVRLGIFFENLTNLFIPKSSRKYSHTNSYSSAMTVIAQDDYLAAGAWAVCGCTEYILLGTLIEKLKTVCDNF